MLTLVCGLRGSGKTTYVYNHLTRDALAYDMDAIASAFRLRQIHEEYHPAARRMANSFLAGFLAHVFSFASDAWIIRTAPSITELEQIAPDRVVIMRGSYVTREMDDREAAAERINDVVEWCAAHGVTCKEVGPSPRGCENKFT